MLDYIKQGDCLELMNELPDSSIDMILCDLPYGMTACKWDKKLSLEDLWKQYNRIIKDNGAIVLFGKEPFTSELVMSNYKGFKHKWIWNKALSGSFNLAKYMPMQITEDVVVFSRKGKRVNYYPIMTKGKMRKRGGAKNTNNVMGKGFIKGFVSFSDDYFPTNILYYPSARKGRFHPTEKPLDLLKYLIQTYSKENEIILDNCIGCGSTAVACLQTNRHFIGYELNEQYVDIASKRLRMGGDNIR